MNNQPLYQIRLPSMSSANNDLQLTDYITRDDIFTRLEELWSRNPHTVFAVHNTSDHQAVFLCVDGHFYNQDEAESDQDPVVNETVIVVNDGQLEIPWPEPYQNELIFQFDSGEYLSPDDADTYAKILARANIPDHIKQGITDQILNHLDNDG